MPIIAMRAVAAGASLEAQVETAPPRRIKLREDIAVNDLGVWRGPHPSGQCEVAWAEFQRRVGWNLDETAASIEVAFRYT